MSVACALALAADPAALPGARRFVRSITACYALDPTATHELVVAVHEALANPVAHAEGCGQIELRAQRLDGSLQVAVADDGRFRPPNSAGSAGVASH